MSFVTRTWDRFHTVHESAVQHAVFHKLFDSSFLHDVLPGPEQRGIYTRGRVIGHGYCANTNTRVFNTRYPYIYDPYTENPTTVWLLIRV